MESPIVKQIEAEATSLTQAEELDLVGRLIEVAKAKGGPVIESDLARYRGILKTNLDPMDFQRQIRAEWD